MARFETLARTVPIPDQVSVQVEGRTVKVKGPLGSLQEDLSHLPVSINVNDNKVQLETTWPRKREIGMLGTAAAHVRNMLKGVTQGYRYELRTVYAHFPVTVKVDEKAKVLKIENFTGEKTKIREDRGRGKGGCQRRGSLRRGHRPEISQSDRGQHSG